MNLLWYWFILGWLGLFAGLMHMISAHRRATRCDWIGGMFVVAGTMCIGLGVIQNLLFVIPFSTILGVLISAAYRKGIRRALPDGRDC